MKKGDQNIILVVENDSHWRKIIVDTLNHKGYLVKISTCYEEAINSIDLLTNCRNIDISLAIVDLVLKKKGEKKLPKNIGDYEGVVLLPRLFKLNIPSIVLTAHGEDAAIVQKVLGEYRPYRFLNKAGFNADAFIDSVEQALKAANPQPQAIGTIADYVITSLLGLISFGVIVGILLLANQLSTSSAGFFALIVLGIFIWFILLIFIAQRSGGIEQSQFGKLLERILNVIERLLFSGGKPSD